MPVLLATLGVPFEEEAVATALDAAVETGLPLVLVNVTRIEPLSLSLLLGYDALEELSPDVSRSGRRVATLASELGIPVERLRVRSPRPVRALLEVIRERQPGLVVFGPDPGHLSRRRSQRALSALRESVDCLVWASSDPDWRREKSVG
jgi:nucleotide-binding universal stress UspA family protein